MRTSTRAILCLLVFFAGVSLALAAETIRVSVDSSGAQANGFCGSLSISAGGEFVSFDGTASNLVPGDTNGTWDVFLRDRNLGVTTRLSVDASGSQGNGASQAPRISANGRYVGFRSAANNLVVVFRK